MADGYAGDVTPQQCWAALADDPRAALIDVRTAAEWTYVGIPDLSPLGKSTILTEWQSFPSMAVDPNFVDRVTAALGSDGPDKDKPLFLLCRSGVRSIAAAKALTAAGYTQCVNVLDGFEGPLDGHGHRGQKTGWKAEELPWLQR
ncbi:rhodanese-like domain-containing protein [Jiella sp. MQZ9-1]|uniref:Rhodanese-like domain-containing protein n=1 Tax=Jiella flava TaxID=2816857 RepID=A0A939JR38_9HYPH|nr:rhodanese-like domain-containing protein [Jiella flava]MBO0661518.1 rhodanese-like domain-containing protein [Jiella flava]MCD2470160.1 rhodanese-like domain-containing protein [Jiella flava]